MPSSAFFDERHSAAVLKHGILGRYLLLFCSKTGYASKGHRVVYLDGYAGPGIYKDEHPGSPALAVSTGRTLAEQRDVLGIYVEKDKDTARQLEEYLSSTGHEYKVLCGDLSRCLEKALLDVGEGDPLFAFFDPFGLPIPLRLMARVMQHARIEGGHRRGPPTEILINFSYPGLRRTAGNLTSTSQNSRYLKARETKLNCLDEVLGGSWWRPIWASGRADRAFRIAAGYIQRLRKVTYARGWYKVPVTRRWDGPVIYDLMFFTHYPKEGLWNYNECTSSAIEAYRQFCTRNQLDLDPAEKREARWIETIKYNILGLLADHGGFVVWKRMTDVYGTTLGYAREKHLRTAIQQLYDENIIVHDGKGRLVDARIERS